MTVAHFDGNNEIMFRDGLDLLGADAPSKIFCEDSDQRDEIRQYLTKQGITTIGGKPLAEVVVSAHG